MLDGTGSRECRVLRSANGALVLSGSPDIDDIGVSGDPASLAIVAAAADLMTASEELLRLRACVEECCRDARRRDEILRAFQQMEIEVGRARSPSAVGDEGSSARPLESGV